MKFMLAMLMSLGSLAAHAELYFEPSQALQTSDWKAIASQQEAFRDSKQSGNIDEALRLALFHVSKAWVYNNQAFAMISEKSGWNDVEVLRLAIEKYELCLKEVAKGITAGHHIESLESCKAKAEKSLKATKTKLETLNSK